MQWHHQWHQKWRTFQHCIHILNEKRWAFFRTDNPSCEKLVLCQFFMDVMPGKFKAEQILIQNVIPRTQREPENSVLQRNETHDVKPVVAVIPWACVKLPQNEATGELPGVKYDEIYEDADFKRNTDFF